MFESIKDQVLDDLESELYIIMGDVDYADEHKEALQKLIDMIGKLELK